MPYKPFSFHTCYDVGLFTTHITKNLGTRLSLSQVRIEVYIVFVLRPQAYVHTQEINLLENNSSHEASRISESGCCYNPHQGLILTRSG
jgi:hypothetical protein